MHYHFRPRYLVDTLNALGFCVSYNDVQSFERNSAISGASTVMGEVNDGSMLMFMADNVDHNNCTLDGKNSFHGMGMIAALKNGSFTVNPVERKKVDNAAFLSASHVEISSYNATPNSLKNVIYKGLPPATSSTTNVDLLWQVSWFFQNPIPSWSGCMQLCYDKQSKGNMEKSQIFFLPIIDLSPSDMSCIFSMLNYLADIAYKHGKPPVITFDQPLFWKASMIVKGSTDVHFKPITLLLGTFHTTMNLLGCIGVLMANSGLTEVLEANIW